MDKRTGRLISILYRKSQMYIAQELKQYHVSSSEYPVLISLSREDGVTQESLADHLSLDKSAVARIIQSLIVKGFVKKQKDENDHRCNRVYLTTEGLCLKDPIERALNDWNQILMSNKNKEEQELIYELLEGMVENVMDAYVDRK